ncbi:protein kinase domain-containing protein [Haliangium ochraceum]|uniref:Serine/threonine protein kinase with WD40 repeats n=1 Tax=Haliangium ochraceum (strain DSM 14365 / JCM 11303 / SMP-2) TaxID=502025 RepID=D0LXR3_HALO1|nr:protein kinase [Haliangium ochraceum]ACY17818.1 serine/threonine protein kinase with WD40 repeats [Haliangium ochraceum DSM 14365]
MAENDGAADTKDASPGEVARAGARVSGDRIDGKTEYGVNASLAEASTFMSSSPMMAALEPTMTAPMRRSGSGARARTPLEPMEAFGRGFGQYELIRPLGHGGMGQVFLGRDTRLGRLVALKFLRYREDASATRFLDEARATARCNHPHIVTIYEVGEHQGAPYMVLEYLPGRTLREWLTQRSERQGIFDQAGHAERPFGLSLSYAVDLMLPVVRALVYAHERGIVHRDLKPENIMLAEAGSLKVLDFGIAMVTEGAEADVSFEQAEDTPGSVATAVEAGTPFYMAPEQWSGDEVDHRCDIWAAGLILFELLCGAHPLAPITRVKLVNVQDLDLPMPRVRDFRDDLGKLGATIDRCLIKRPEDRLGSAKELLDVLESTVRPHRGSAYDQDTSPYPGLVAYQESDAERFFGRSQAVTMVVNRLSEIPLLVVLGPSGAGKSSFVRAGVVPALDRTGDAWESFVVRPGARPVAALASLLRRHAWDTGTEVSAGAAPTEPLAGENPMPPGISSEEIGARLRAEPGYLGAQLRARARRRLSRVVLFVDQFEEVYTLASLAERKAFFACLSGVADDVDAPLRVVIALRSDFLDLTTDAQAAIPGFHRGITLLPPMDRPALREALVRPLEPLAYRFESSELVEDMLDALENTASALPLLQFTASKLWELRDPQQRMLTRGSYDTLGGVAGILAVHADAVLATMAAGDRALARVLLLRLVTPERTRAVVSISELYDLAEGTSRRGAEIDSVSEDDAGDEGVAGEQARPGARGVRALGPVSYDDIDRVLGQLVNARLLVVENDDIAASAAGGATDISVELVHESLIDRWPTLATWVSESYDDMAFVERLRRAAREWRDHERADELLWQGSAAERAWTWYQPYAGELTPVEREYIEAVRAHAVRAQRQRRLFVGGAIAVLLFFAVAMTLLAWRERQANQLAAQQAERAQTETARARAQARMARDASRIAVARELEDEDPTTVLALLREVEEPELARSWPMLVSRALRTGVARAVLSGHEDQVYAAAFSPEGERVVTAGWDGTARIWDADGVGTPVVLRGHTGRINAVHFSPDGTSVLTASVDHSARVWNANGAGEPLVLEGHTDEVVSAVFSPDGERVATASADGRARVWSVRAVVAGRAKSVTLRGHTGPVRAVAFSPDGERVVTASADGTARVWSADGTGAAVVLRGHSDQIRAVSFSPDGERVVTASADGTARVWSADGSGEPVVLRGHQGWVVDVCFSPDGERVATASFDNSARVWLADGSGEPVVLAGHTQSVASVRFSPEGERVVTASYDKTARAWPADGLGTSVLFQGHGGLVRTAAFSGDGERVVTASEDGTARVWKARGVPQPQVVHAHQGAVYSMMFSADGAQLLSASADGTARLWRLDGGDAPVVFEGHAGALTGAMFDPSGERIVTSSFDKTARVWTLGSDAAPVVLEGHTGWLSEAVFSPDGRSVATASSDGTVRLWDAGSGRSSAVFRGHAGEVMNVGFSPDGARLVSASADQSARVWTVAEPEAEPLVFGHPSVVYSASFSADGRYIVTAADDGVARVWAADGRSQPRTLRGHADSLTSASFSPDGRRVVTASRDRSAWIWDLEGEGAPLVLDGHPGWVGQAVFSPDGRRVATSASDGSIWLWSDVAPIAVDTDALWRATSYCLPVDARRSLLSADAESAAQDFSACVARVARVAESARE